MLLRMIRVLALPLVLLHAGSAFALIDAEALVGKRWYVLGTDPNQHVAATEVALAAHIDPIPLVPVSFGLKVSSATLNESDLKSGSNITSISTSTMMEAGLDVMAWIPLVPIVTPYARLNIPVYGLWKTAGKAGIPGGPSDDFTSDGRVSGAQLSVGVKYSPLPLIAVLFEVNRAAENWKQQDAKFAGQSQSADSKTHTLNSNAVFLGLEVGL